MNLFLIIAGCVLLGICILYLLMIMPRMLRRPDRKPFLAVYYAHRGLHDNATNAPENSMRAFEKAVEAGYGIEMDIQLSKDKVPVVFHDFTLERVCGAKGKISDYTYEELQAFALYNSKEKIPGFKEVLAMVDGRVPLIVEFKIEFKENGLCAAADKLLRDYRGLYCMESFNPFGVLWYRRNHKEVMRGQLSDAFVKEGKYKGLLYWVLQNLLLNFVTKPDFIAFNHKHPHMLSRKICHGLYRSTAAAWTIKSQQELNCAKEQFDIYIFDSFIPESGK